jgi:hypothetical protein
MKHDSSKRKPSAQLGESFHQRLNAGLISFDPKRDGIHDFGLNNHTSATLIWCLWSCAG